MQHLSQRQSVGQQIKYDPLEKGFTRNTAPSWWIALDTMEKLENCPKKLQRGVSRKRRNWAKQQKTDMSKLELRSELGRTWVKLVLEHFENEMSQPSSAQPLLANIFTQTERQLLFTWCLAEKASQDLNSCEKLKYVSRFVWEIGGNLLSRRGISDKFSFSSNIFAILHLSNSKIYFVLNLS